MSSLLEFKNVSVRRGSEVVLESVSFKLTLHQIIGLTGPNGAGKTTLFETLMGLCPITSGEIEWAKPIEMAYLPQQVMPKKIMPLTVEDFVKMGTWGINKKSSPALGFEDALKVLELRSISKKLVSEISGGEWRRALLARSLVQRADLYLLDEPFNQLDLQMESRVGQLLQDLSRSHHKTFFIISHDWHAMDHYFDRLLLLNKRIIADGSVREVSDVHMNWKAPEHHEWMHL
ncbi:MAG: zinc transporter ATP-binding protein [Bacteriovoracaceae bacterium]|nr:zinc transporter ATP-binding protein [Bacteriovoracaceae bacterium]